MKSGEVQNFGYQLPANPNFREYEVRVVANGADTALVIVGDVTREKAIEWDDETGAGGTADIEHSAAGDRRTTEAQVPADC